jgi:anti-sigma factor RsiW
MAMTRQPDERPDRREILELLPWHAAGTLTPAEAARVEAALARDPELAREFELAREELGGVVDVNEASGRPSPKALDALFAKIDAEPTRRPAPAIGASIAAFFARLSPRTLAWTAAAAALVIAMQAVVIGGAAMRTLSPAQGPELAGHVAPRGEGSYALVTFRPTASIAQVSQALRAQDAVIVEGPKAGVFTVRLSPTRLTPDQAKAAVERLRKDPAVAFVLPA